MKIVVLASPESWYLGDLRRAAAGKHEVRPVEHRRLTAHLGRQCSGFCAGPDSLEDADALLVRTMESGSLEQVVFRMDVLGMLAASGTPVINSPRAVEVAVDKYLAAAKCQAAGLTVPETVVCQSTADALRGFDHLGGDVVVKPLFGGEGRGLCRVSDRDLALRAFKMLAQLQATLYLQQFVPHNGTDLRLFVVGETVLGMRRHNSSDWRSNVSRGGSTEPVTLTDELIDIALRAVAAVGAEVAGVDVLGGPDGRWYVLEVNAVPGWKALAKTVQVDVAKLVLDHIVARVSAGG